MRAYGKAPGRITGALAPAAFGGVVALTRPVGATLARSLTETFLEVVRSIGSYRGEGHFWGWIRRIAASKALMRIRKEQIRATDELVEEEAAGRPAAPVGARIDLERAFERLSDTARAVVWLHDVEGYTHEEIAELMGKTVSFSKSQLARAHQRLRGMLEEGAGTR